LSVIYGLPCRSVLEFKLCKEKAVRRNEKLIFCCFVQFLVLEICKLYDKISAELCFNLQNSMILRGSNCFLIKISKGAIFSSLRWRKSSTFVNNSREKSQAAGKSRRHHGNFCTVTHIVYVIRLWLHFSKNIPLLFSILHCELIQICYIYIYSCIYNYV